MSSDIKHKKNNIFDAIKGFIIFIEGEILLEIDICAYIIIVE